MRQGTLGIGLNYYQEQQWINAIRRHGRAIMDKSLLSIDQKTMLNKYANQVINVR